MALRIRWPEKSRTCDAWSASQSMQARRRDRGRESRCERTSAVQTVEQRRTRQLAGTLPRRERVRQREKEEPTAKKERRIVPVGQKAVDHCAASTMRRGIVWGIGGKRRVRWKKRSRWSYGPFKFHVQSPCSAGSTRGDGCRAGLD
jgi:hypothetical protein